MLKLYGTAILLKLHLIKKDNQLRLCLLNTQQMDTRVVLLIMVFNSISMRDLNIQ